jgi:PKD repeat protein
MKKYSVLAILIVVLLSAQFVSGYKETDGLGTSQSTHQFIMDCVPTILRNDGYPYLAEYLTGTSLIQMKYGSMRADETLWDSREHYMDPSTHEGFLGFKSGGQLARERFNAAVGHWNAGNKVSAFYELGWATHLVQDLTVPHHAALTALDHHSEYEQWVLDHQDDYVVTSGGTYDFSSHLPGHYDDESDSFDWVDYNAHFSIDFFGYVDGPNGEDDNNYDFAASALLSRAERTSAGFVFMFLSTVNSPPTADAGGSKIADQGVYVQFGGSLSSDDMSVAEYTWDFGDGSFGYGETVYHSYSLLGTYDASLTVRDSFGEVDSDDFVVSIRDATPPIASAGEDVYIGVGDTVHLDGSESDDNVAIEEYTWIIGETVIGYGSTMDYVFNIHGSYIITLEVEDEDGNTDSDVVAVVVLDKLSPVANAGENRTLEIGQIGIFNASSSSDDSGLVSYFWNLGDGNTTIGEIVEHSYEKAGTYIVTLVVEDVSGNLDKDRIVVIVVEESEKASNGNNVLLFIAIALAVIVALVVVAIIWKLRAHK